MLAVFHNLGLQKYVMEDTPKTAVKDAPMMVEFRNDPYQWCKNSARNVELINHSQGIKGILGHTHYLKGTLLCNS